VNYKFSHYKSFAVPTVEIRGKKGIYYWLDREPIVWVDEEGSSHETPRNMVSDGFSVPKFAWGLLACLDSRIPGFVHDSTYWLQPCTKKMADYNVYAGVCSLAVGKVWYKRFLIRRAARLIWCGLKVGGFIAWSRYKEQLEHFGYEGVITMHTSETLDGARVIANRGMV